MHNEHKFHAVDTDFVNQSM